MKKVTTTIIAFFCIFNYAVGQTYGEKNTVSIKITNFTNSSVSFSWDNFSVSSTDIYRKEISDVNWTRIKRNATTQSYTDNSIDTAKEYEYRFQVSTGSTPAYAYGYIAFGVKVPSKPSRGTILVMVDDRFQSSLSTEIATLNIDLISDGWSPIFRYCSKDSSVSCVKQMVDSIHTAYSLNAVYIIGHIPVAYSGLIYPDGHTDHRGAWPSDIYYVSDPNNWTDNGITYTNSSRPAQSNNYYDGKHDESTVSDELYCPISRVDFYDLSTNPNSELSTLSNYLQEASKYKRGQIEVVDKGLVDDNLTGYYEGFSQNGHMNFASLFGDSVDQGDYLTTLENTTYKWSYACSFGTDTSIHNIATTTELYNSDYKGIFSMMFGSYFGDWNTQNNLMRAALADGKMLTNCWAGRPNWFFHHMGLNNPIGFSTKKTIENGTFSGISSTAYPNTGSEANSVHMQLLGDLTLRQEYNPVVEDFVATYRSSSSDILLEWTPSSTSAIVEYEIYKSSNGVSGYSLIATVDASDSTYVDSSVDSLNYYYIKYTSLQSTLSGTYYNNSLGSPITLDTTNVTSLPVELMVFTAEAVNNDAELKWSTASEENFSHFEVEKSIDGYVWEHIGDVQGSMNSSERKDYTYIDNYLTQGTTYYRLLMIDIDQQYEYSPVRAVRKKAGNAVVIYPNPTNQRTITVIAPDDLEYHIVEVFNNNMQKMPVPIGGRSIDMSSCSKGMYYIRIDDTFKKLILL